MYFYVIWLEIKTGTEIYCSLYQICCKIVLGIGIFQVKRCKVGLVRSYFTAIHLQGFEINGNINFKILKCSNKSGRIFILIHREINRIM